MDSVLAATGPVTDLPRTCHNLISKSAPLHSHRRSILRSLDSDCNDGPTAPLVGFLDQGRSRLCRLHRDATPIDSTQLANGLSMPQIHLGVYLTQGHETSQAVRWALEVRMFLISTYS